MFSMSHIGCSSCALKNVSRGMIKCLTWYGAVNAAVPGTPLVVGALLVVVTGYTTFHSRRRRFNARSKKACRRGWHCSLAGSRVTRASRRWPRESAATVSLQAAFQTITDSMPPFLTQTTSSSSPSLLSFAIFGRFTFRAYPQKVVVHGLPSHVLNQLPHHRCLV